MIIDGISVVIKLLYVCIGFRTAEADTSEEISRGYETGVRTSNLRRVRLIEYSI